MRSLSCTKSGSEGKGKKESGARGSKEAEHHRKPKQSITGSGEDHPLFMGAEGDLLKRSNTITLNRRREMKERGAHKQTRNHPLYRKGATVLR